MRINDQRRIIFIWDSGDGVQHVPQIDVDGRELGMAREQAQQDLPHRDDRRGTRAPRRRASTSRPRSATDCHIWPSSLDAILPIVQRVACRLAPPEHALGDNGSYNCTRQPLTSRVGMRF